jgi:hypothetical protein
MKREYLQFSLEGEVSDLDALHAAALSRCMRENPIMDEREADEYCRDSDGEKCPRRCLQMLLDPGSLPGFEIAQSNVD